MPIPTKAFEMPYEEYSQRFLRQYPGASEQRCRMEWLNAKDGPQTAAMIHQAAEKQLSGVDLITNLETAYKAIGDALTALRNAGGAKQ